MEMQRRWVATHCSLRVKPETVVRDVICARFEEGEQRVRLSRSFPRGEENRLTLVVDRRGMNHRGGGVATGELLSELAFRKRDRQRSRELGFSSEGLPIFIERRPAIPVGDEETIITGVTVFRAPENRSLWLGNSADFDPEVGSSSSCRKSPIDSSELVCDRARTVERERRFIVERERRHTERFPPSMVGVS